MVMSKWLSTATAAAALLVAAVVDLACEGVLRTAPPRSTLELIANPEFIPANGGVSTITAIVTEPAGTPVSNGTVVQFFTNLGRIDPQGRTTNGITRVRLVSDSRSGTAKVVAISGGSPAPSASPDTTGGGPNRDEVEVTIGNLNARSILVTADPPGVSLNGTSYITANVFDERGNPVQAAPVFFRISGVTTVPTPAPTPTPAPAEPARDSLDSGGAAQFTDNDGRAFDVLRVRRTAPGTVTVQARVPAGGTDLLAGEVVVRIQ
jgi:hypothetical protein